MSGERIEAEIHAWVEQHYPDGPDWMDPDFDALRSLPTEIRMIPIFSAIEYHIGNGGWSQFLWNCFGCWREMLDVAEAGYSLIGADEQRQALAHLREYCDRDEAECEEMLLEYSEENNTFAEFTRRSYLSFAKNEDTWQVCLTDSSAPRFAWLERNEPLVRRLLTAQRDA